MAVSPLMKRAGALNFSTDRTQCRRVCSEVMQHYQMVSMANSATGCDSCAWEKDFTSWSLHMPAREVSVEGIEQHYIQTAGTECGGIRYHIGWKLHACHGISLPWRMKSKTADLLLLAVLKYINVICFAYPKLLAHCYQWPPRRPQPVACSCAGSDRSASLLATDSRCRFGNGLPESTKKEKTSRLHGMV